MPRNLQRPPGHAAWRFPEQLVGQGTKLLTQQCWYWGCDVRCPEGNLLLANGFTRTRPPAGVEGSMVYVLVPFAGAQLTLWSFGVFFGCEGAGGLFLNRFRFEPLVTDCASLGPEIWQIDQLPALGRATAANRPQIATLLGGLLRRVIAYEHRVLAVQGLPYREACLNQWSPQRLALPAAALVPAWERFAHSCEQALSGTRRDEEGKEPSCTT